MVATLSIQKNYIIPANQADSWKGGCTTDHLVKFTSHINGFQGEKVFWPHLFMLKRCVTDKTIN